MIHIIHFSDGHKHFKEAIAEYEKRLSRDIAIHTIKPVKHTEISYIKEKESEKLLEKLSKISGKIFLCDERGNSYTSEKFSECIQNIYNNGENIIFIIGGSYGVDISALEKKFPISLLKFSDMVMPHGLAFLFLIEQIYRAFQIQK